MVTLAEPVPALRSDAFLDSFKNRVSRDVQVPFESCTWNGGKHTFTKGAAGGTPRLQILIENEQGLRALRTLDEVHICEAYMRGDIDIKGSVMDFVELRSVLTDSHPLHRLWRRVAPLFVGRVTSDRQAIASHYEFDSDFYLSFMDPTRCYSQAVFSWDGESLEAAQRRKLEFAVASCGLKPGDRVLDVGGGWGAFAEYAGRLGINVTVLTLSQKSVDFLTSLIQTQNLPCSVEYADFMDYAGSQDFDAIVVLGVMEHLPKYEGVLQQFLKLLKPGGRVYIDASAARKEYAKPTFISRYVFPGDHSYFCLHTFLRAMSQTPMEVLSVMNDRHNYYLTCRNWAENLDRNQDEIVRRWGEGLYRKFRLYLWGSAAAFLNGSMDAYRLLLKKP
jgi:cyclopropane-fatty-acyl-phospholipid synthase